MAGIVGVILVIFSNETSVPSAFLIVSLAAVCGINLREPTSDMERVDEVGGGNVKLRFFEECARAEGWVRSRGEAIV